MLKNVFIGALFLSTVSINSVFSQTSVENPIFVMPSGVETRWSSPENFKGEKGVAARENAGRKGSPCFPLKSGEVKNLAEVSGKSGTVRRIWITISDRSPKMLRGLKLDFYWDGQSKPAASVPIGDFFGHGIGQMATFENVFFSSPEGRSFCCTIPMPFRTGMKIIVTNETDTDLPMLFYDIDYTLGDKQPENMLYFHACYQRENPTVMQKDYEILPKINGAGRFLGVNIGVIVDKKTYLDSWWGEGEIKFFMDGDTDHPTISGTGTEDYIGTGWGMGQYVTMYQGCTLGDGENMRYCFYRYHAPDPVYFLRNIRVTMQQIGCAETKVIKKIIAQGAPLYKNGPGKVAIDAANLTDGSYILFERMDDWSSCCYFYLNRPVNDLPALDQISKRTKGL